MKKFLLFLLASTSLIGANSLMAQGTAFTYQGQLQNNGAPANGQYDFTFSLFNNNATNTGQVGATLTDNGVGVTNGLFTVTLDFGPVFSNSATWLFIAVRTNGAGSFTGLNPLQALTPAPYAIFAEGARAAGLTGTIAANNIANGTITSNLLAAGAVGSSQIDPGIGLWSKSGSSVYYNNGGVGIGTSAPSGGFNVVNSGNINTFLTGGSSVGTWLTLGNTGGGAQWTFISSGSGNGEGASNLLIYPGTSLGGVNSSQGIEIQSSGRVGIGTRNITSMLTVNGSGSFNGALVAGFTGNSLGASAQNSTIAGGGVSGNPNTIQSSSSFIGAGNLNTISSNLNNSFIGAGFGNSVGSLASFIGSGNNNAIQGNSPYDFIGGGQGGVIQSNSALGFIGGGIQNVIQASSSYDFIGGGGANVVQSNNLASDIGGGEFNVIQTNAQVSFIGGGYGNVILANAVAATIGGGSGNKTGGNYATAPGGANNTASGNYSFAAGANAQALHQGAFVWADSEGTAFSSTANDQFLVRAKGGVGINTTTPTENLSVASIFTGTTNDTATLSLAAAGGRKYILQSVTGDGGGSPAGAFQLIDTAVGPYLTVLAGGNVGIGTITPASALDVVGDIHASGQIIGDASGLTDVALLDGNQTFTGQNAFAGILARGGPPGPSGANNNGYAFSGNGGDNDSGMFSSADGQIEFYNNAIEAMRIVNGSVGIGVTNPSSMLEVAGSATFDGFVGIGTASPLTRLHVDVGNGGGFSDPAAIFAVENCGNACGQPAWTEGARLWNQNLYGRVGLSLMVGGSGALSNTPGVYLGTGDSDQSNDFRIATETAGGLTDRLYINGTTGNVGIGTTTPTAMLDIKSMDTNAAGVRLEDPTDSGYWNMTIDPNGDTLVFSYNEQFPYGGYSYLAPNSAGLITTSDRRVKKDVEAMGPCLDRVMALKPSTFRYKTAEDGSPVNYGFIAQDVEQEFPDLVQERNGLKTLVGAGLTAINTRAIQDLNQKLEEKDTEIQDLKARLERLEQRLEQSPDGHSEKP